MVAKGFLPPLATWLLHYSDTFHSLFIFHGHLSNLSLLSFIIMVVNIIILLLLLLFLFCYCVQDQTWGLVCVAPIKPQPQATAPFSKCPDSQTEAGLGFLNPVNQT